MVYVKKKKTQLLQKLKPNLNHTNKHFELKILNQFNVSLPLIPCLLPACLPSCPNWAFTKNTAVLLDL